MKKRIKIQGFLIFLAVIILAILYRHLFLGYHHKTTRLLLDIVGSAIFSLGYALRITARGYKATLNPEGKTLVIDGPYAITRNPMYLGTLLIGLSVILMLLKWWVGLIFLAIYLAIYIPEIKKEEAKLTGLFGDKFKKYCLITPRFFPSVKSLLKPQPPDKIKLRFSWVKKELCSLIPLLIFIAVIRILEAMYL